MAIEIKMYDHVLESAFVGEFDFSADTFKLALLASSYTFDADDTMLSDLVAHEIANGNGYATGGQTLSSVAFSRSDDIIKLDADDEQFVASGGTMGAFRYGVVYDSSHVDDLLLCCIDLNAVKTLASGDDYTFAWDAANGIIRLGLGDIT